MKKMINNLWMVSLMIIVLPACTLFFGDLADIPDLKAVFAYLETHGAVLKPTDEAAFTGFELLDTHLAAHDLFLTGESHGLRINYTLKLKYLQYLNEHAGVRYYLSEEGYASSVVINRFLETGDTQLIDRIAYTVEQQEVLRTVLENINGELAAGSSAYEIYFGSNYFAFEFIVKNCMARYTFCDQGDRAFREATIYTNFLTLYTHLPADIERKFFGQWGISHIFQEAIRGKASFVAMLQQDDSPVKGRTLSINTYYEPGDKVNS